MTRCNKRDLTAVAALRAEAMARGDLVLALLCTGAIRGESAPEREVAAILLESGEPLMGDRAAPGTEKGYEDGGA